MKIALIADTHLAPIARDLTANARAALAWIDQAGVDLVLHLGDVSADGAGDARQLDFAAGVMAGLGTPVRYLPGNHDVGDNPAPGVRDHHGLLDAARLADFRRLFDQEHWVLRGEGWTLLGLNAQRFGFGDAGEAAQFAWLEQTLAGVDGPCGLLLHKPLFRDGWDDTAPHPRYVPLGARQRLRALFASRDLRFVISGHTHQWRRVDVEGVEHVWAPSTAFTVPDLMQETIGEKRLGLLTLNLEPDAHVIELHRPQGLRDHDLADHAQVYPALGPLLEDLRHGKPYPRR
jgi:3',5'-cyclic AMP phosphodiesterase CpdA